MAAENSLDGMQHFHGKKYIKGILTLGHSGYMWHENNLLRGGKCRDTNWYNKKTLKRKLVWPKIFE
jgi:hypothetical protein